MTTEKTHDADTEDEIEALAKKLTDELSDKIGPTRYYALLVFGESVTDEGYTDLRVYSDGPIAMALSAMKHASKTLRDVALKEALEELNADGSLDDAVNKAIADLKRAAEAVIQKRAAKGADDDTTH